MELTPTDAPCCPEFPPSPHYDDDVFVPCASPSAAYALHMALVARNVTHRLDIRGVWVAGYLADWVRRLRDGWIR